MSNGKQLAFRVRDLIGVASARILGRSSAATGRAEELTAVQVRTLLDVYTRAETETLVSGTIEAVIGSAPEALDTLAELAAALGDDANFASSVTTALAGKAALDHTHLVADITDFDASAYATSAQGAKADTALQPAAIASGTITPRSGNLDLNSIGTIGGSTGATDNAILRADGTGGATLQNSGVTISDNNEVLIVSGVASAKPLCVRGAASQAGNLQEWQNSAGVIQASVNASGVIAIPDGASIIRIGEGNQAGFGFSAGTARLFGNGFSDAGRFNGVQATLPGSLLINGVFIGSRVQVNELSDTVAIPTQVTRRMYANSGDLVLGLPSASAGLDYYFSIANASTMRINAASNDKIRIATRDTALAGYLESATLGSSLRLIAINADLWQVVHIHGVWTDGTFIYDDTGLIS